MSIPVTRSRRPRRRAARYAAVLVGATLAVVAATAGPAVATGSSTTLTTVLTGAAEVPPGSGDPDGVGAAVLNVTPATGQVCYALAVAKIDTITSVHVHNAPSGQRGPDVFDLENPTNGFVAACTTIDATDAAAIAAEPQNYYVEVHTVAFPAGALRGNLQELKK
jgi:hypothetical protein